MADNDHTVEYVGSAAVWRQAGRGRVATQANPRIDGLEKAEADTLVANHDFEHVDADDATESDSTTDESPDESSADETESDSVDENEAPEPLDGTVSEVEDALVTGEYDDQLVDLYNAEREHDDRSGAIDAIQDRREELRAEPAEEPEGEPDEA